MTWLGKEIENTFDMTNKVMMIPSYCIGVEGEKLKDENYYDEEDQETQITAGVDLNHLSVYTSSIQMKEILNLKNYDISEARLANTVDVQMVTTPRETNSLEIDDSEPLSVIINRNA